VLGGIVVALVRHIDFISQYAHYHVLLDIWGATFALSIIQWIMSWWERPYSAPPGREARLDRMRVTVNMPVYNEDQAVLDRALYSLFTQTRMPDRVQVVDDGSLNDYAEIRDYWLEHHPAHVDFSWVRQENQGKKHAQARTFRDDDSDILVTLDSDTALERHAIQEGLKPFADRRVQSVAGLELAYNYRQNWLTRLNGTRSLIWQLLSCSAQSIVGDILVNRGTFALYRAPVIQDNLDAYLYETFFGHSVHLGDDAALTLFARARGRAVQQPSAIQLAMYPEKLGHQTRQWLRWMRGSTIRTFWRIRYLSPLSYSWWFTVVSLWTFFASTAALILVGALWPASAGYLLTMAIATVIWSYAMAVRIFTVRRSDETFWTRLGSFLLAPVTALWVITWLRLLRYIGMFTCLRQGWATRAHVEVGISGDQ
jgi:hyaluronan synthase